MEKMNNTYAILCGARGILRSIADKKILNSFIRNFTPTFNELMKEKKFLYISCEGFEWVNIYDDEEQLKEMSSRQEHHHDEDYDDNFSVEVICKEITYDEFVEMTKGDHMNFEKYSTIGGDLTFDF